MMHMRVCQTVLFVCLKRVRAHIVKRKANKLSIFLSSAVLFIVVSCSVTMDGNHMNESQPYNVKHKYI